MPKLLIMIFSAAVLILQFYSCTEDTSISYDKVTIDDVFNATDPAATGVFYPETSDYVNLTYNLDLGSVTADVYFVLTNKSMNSSASAHNVSSSYISSNPSLKSIRPAEKTASGISPAKRGKPEISSFNMDPFTVSDKKIDNSSYSMSYIAPLAPAFEMIYKLPANDDYEGRSGTFDVDSHETVDAKCRYSETILTEFGNKKLNIWVADDCWYDGLPKEKEYQVTATMVQDLADEFLYSISNNDIYDWVTGIFGEEWGNHGYSQLIPADDNITILLFDIDGDNDSNLYTGYVAGYYYSKDNFLRSHVDYSNERIMFYLDAVAYACPNGTWEITDPRPADSVLTLAHEIQHMIHFYQKNVLRVNDGNGTQTWINEMCSLMAEDLICSKLGSSFSGPRGLAGTTADDGFPGNSHGWLPYYVSNPDTSLTRWNESDLGLDYATAYSFGAYIGRNFGGAILFNDIVQNAYTDSRAITSAIEQATMNTFFYGYSNLLRSWGAAVLLSDLTTMDEDYDYGLIFNRLDWYVSTESTIDYDLGAINMFNYGSGLQIYYPSTITSGGKLPPSSNRYILAAENVTGLVTWNIKLDEDVRLTVVLK